MSDGVMATSSLDFAHAFLFFVPTSYKRLESGTVTLSLKVLVCFEQFSLTAISGLIIIFPLASFTVE